ncbi:MAG: transporter ATP-binding protein [Oscillospiraceae bacterium]|nr:transporter ATP-binding protein [Oscillospiraceae bacterium]
MSDVILDIRHLRTSFFQNGTEVRAVDDMSYQVRQGECVAIIGESGSGKSVSAMSIFRLIPYPPGIIRGGEILFKGHDLMKLSYEEMEKIRGSEISMIFQEPSTALNPVIPIGKQIVENILLHSSMSKQEAWQRAELLLAKLDIPNPAARLKEYPHQFSGGMQQRAMIAMAMSCQPSLLIADEPTTALDVTVQAQVLEQLNELRQEYGTALIIITHNLGIVARYADSVKIVYGGKIVEEGSVRDIFNHPHHPYTIGLINAVPRLDLPRSHGLRTIEGEPPDMSKIAPDSCAFKQRCRYATEECGSRRPPLTEVGEGHSCACFHMNQAQEGAKEVVM